MKHVAVVGGGTMGVGIAYVSAMAGATVTVVEPDQSRALAFNRTVDETILSSIARGKIDAAGGDALRSRIERVTTVEQVPLVVDVAIETVSEKLELKLEVLAAMAARAPKLIGSNTSAMSIDRLAQALPDPTIFLGMHFFNPVWSLPLVELVRGQYTSEASLIEARHFVEWLGKQSLTVRDVPGFATSRLDLISSLEAMRMVESGVTTATDIDKAAVLAYRHPVGPLRLSDIVGLDVRLDIARTLEAAHGSRFSPPQILIDMVAEGKLGVKSGEGFFSWPQ
ncbi:3-hydroxyacyl-CoA dehydrogenase NAD-binding domain-containing protein [Sphingorhabdus sp.]|uniref:3-hydroxyacyl-CoA dehydrogenase family protein n=1 Tax=Sphingorhabdus sp. TaxID=1902408 RepID=UPI00262C50E3|nr:3-hydroxyacyl-CoA dehydrogenase NAD-binding domain-containing protein [Sphingorhabdus sp.]MDH4399564.1 3-hydroxyacyl-CoA dehydrogenase NAD-binding domain-containing protein [Sphingorhabdus sp.]